MLDDMLDAVEGVTTHGIVPNRQADANIGTAEAMPLVQLLDPNRRYIYGLPSMISSPGL